MDTELMNKLSIKTNSLFHIGVIQIFVPLGFVSCFQLVESLSEDEDDDDRASPQNVTTRFCNRFSITPSRCAYKNVR